MRTLAKVDSPWARLSASTAPAVRRASPTSSGRPNVPAFRASAPPPKRPASLVNSRTSAVDLNYGAAAVPFLAWANAAGCRKQIDGLGMLVEQAAEAFHLWHGRHPDTDPVYAQLRAQLL